MFLSTTRLQSSTVTYYKIIHNYKAHAYLPRSIHLHTGASFVTALLIHYLYPHLSLSHMSKRIVGYQVPILYLLVVRKGNMGSSLITLAIYTVNSICHRWNIAVRSEVCAIALDFPEIPKTLHSILL